MTKLLEQAIEAARLLPPEEQDELAAVLLQLMGGEDGEIYQLSPEEEAALAESLAQAARGEYATDEEVEAVFAKYRP